MTRWSFSPSNSWPSPTQFFVKHFKRCKLNQCLSAFISSQLVPTCIELLHCRKLVFKVTRLVPKVTNGTRSNRGLSHLRKLSHSGKWATSSYLLRFQASGSQVHCTTYSKPEKVNKLSHLGMKRHGLFAAADRVNVWVRGD